MLALARVVIASMIGVQGLGQPVLRDISHQDLTLGMLNGLVIEEAARTLSADKQTAVNVVNAKGKPSDGSGSIQLAAATPRSIWIDFSNHKPATKNRAVATIATRCCPCVMSVMIP